MGTVGGTDVRRNQSSSGRSSVGLWQSLAWLPQGRVCSL